VKLNDGPSTLGTNATFGLLTDKWIELNGIRCSSCGRWVADESVATIVISHETLHHAIDRLEGFETSLAFDTLHRVAIVHDCKDGREMTYYVGECGQINFLKHPWTDEA